MITTADIIAAARKYVGAYPLHEASARVALEDAVNLQEQGDLFYARKRALTSLQYSLGVLSPIYQRAVAVHLMLSDRDKHIP